jgi:hypothetical protein
MTKSKSTMLFAVLCLTVASAHVFRAAAQSRTSPPPKTESELLTVLDNSIWIADGKPSDKQIYLIAGPCCGYSQALYYRSRQLGNKVQLRWIEDPWPKDQRCLGYVAEAAMKNDASVLVDMYRAHAAPESVPQGIKDNAIQWNSDVFETVLAFRQVSSMPFPTAVWLSKDGVRIAERPESLDAIAQTVAPRPEAANLTPASRRFLSAEYHFESIPRRIHAAYSGGTKVFSQPASSSRLLGYLDKDRGNPAKGRVTVGNETWIELDLGARVVFVRESEVRPQQ